jgi:hypothetical protein
MVALTAWLTRARSTDWDDTLYMAIYPVNGDRSGETRDYLSTLDTGAFTSIADFFAREGQRYGLALERPLAIELGTEVAEPPPAPPASANPLAIAWWSMQLRWVAWRTEHAQSLPSPDIRMFVVYYDPQTHERLAHSLGLVKGLIGVVNAFADRDYGERNDVVIAHETLHTLGATDKYDPRPRCRATRTATRNRRASRCTRSARPRSWAGASRSRRRRRRYPSASHFASSAS